MFGSPDGMLEGAHDETSEHWDDEAAEVCSDATEGQPVVHALAQQGVQPDPHASLPQVLFQSVKELPYLRYSVVTVHVYKLSYMYMYVRRAHISSPSPDKIRTKLSNVRIKMSNSGQILIHFPIITSKCQDNFKCCCEHWYVLHIRIICTHAQGFPKLTKSCSHSIAKHC